MFRVNILVLSFIVTLQTAVGEDELLAVTLLYRHGDRTPDRFYPNDPNKDPSLWPVPPGELTNIGKVQHYNLGKWLRNRYNGFLSSIYNKSEIYVRSSDMNRCIMSAEANLAGLYPPQGKDVWTDDLLWQPIPVHSVPIEEDDIAEVPESFQKFLEYAATVEALPYWKQINEENKEFYQILTEKSGMMISEIAGSMFLFDILHTELIHNKSLPDWAVEAFPKLENLFEKGLPIFTYTTDLARIFTGRFFDNVFLQFSSFAERNISNQQRHEKFRVFSAHDMQVVSLLNTLKFKNLKMVPYAATLIFELRRTVENKLYAQVLYKTKETSADVIQIEDCDFKCDVDKFLQILKPKVLTEKDFKSKCNS